MHSFIKLLFFPFLLSAVLLLSACTQPEAETTPAEELPLWYQEESSLIYLPLFRTGSPGAYGLADVNGNLLVPEEYTDILPLPTGYALQDDKGWRFTGSDLTPKDGEYWQQIQPLRKENGLLSGTILVQKQDLWGCMNLQGELLIPPLYESLEKDAASPWGLYRAAADGRWGYLSANGEEVIPLIYDYVVTDRPAMGQTQGVFVLADQTWGFVPMDSQGKPGDILWGVEPATATAANLSINNP